MTMIYCAYDNIIGGHSPGGITLIVALASSEWPTRLSARHW